MSTMKQPADKGSKRKKLKLNKETLKDLSLPNRGAQALKGGGPKTTPFQTCYMPCTMLTNCGGCQNL